MLFQRGALFAVHSITECDEKVRFNETLLYPTLPWDYCTRALRSFAISNPLHVSCSMRNNIPRRTHRLHRPAPEGLHGEASAVYLPLVTAGAKNKRSQFFLQGFVVRRRLPHDIQGYFLRLT